MPYRAGANSAVVTSTAQAGDHILRVLSMPRYRAPSTRSLPMSSRWTLPVPGGGRLHVNIDDELTEVDAAILNNPGAQSLITNTFKLEHVDTSNYKAVFPVGDERHQLRFPRLLHSVRRGSLGANDRLHSISRRDIVEG